MSRTPDIRLSKKYAKSIGSWDYRSPTSRLGEWNLPGFRFKKPDWIDPRFAPPSPPKPPEFRGNQMGEDETGENAMFGDSGGFPSKKPPLPRAKPKPLKARRKERLIKALFEASHGRDK